MTFKKNYFLFLFLLIIAFIVCLAFCSHIERTYTRKGTITQIDDKGIIIQDTKGNEWKVTTFSIGDKVKLVMDNNLTDSNIEDDIIKDIIIE